MEFIWESKQEKHTNMYIILATKTKQGLKIDEEQLCIWGGAFELTPE